MRIKVNALGLVTAALCARVVYSVGDQHFVSAPLQLSAYTAVDSNGEYIGEQGCPLVMEDKNGNHNGVHYELATTSARSAKRFENGVMAGHVAAGCEFIGDDFKFTPWDASNLEVTLTASAVLLQSMRTGFYFFGDSVGKRNTPNTSKPCLYYYQTPFGLWSGRIAAGTVPSGKINFAGEWYSNAGPFDLLNSDNSDAAFENPSIPWLVWYNPPSGLRSEQAGSPHSFGKSFSPDDPKWYYGFGYHKVVPGTTGEVSHPEHDSQLANKAKNRQWSVANHSTNPSPGCGVTDDADEIRCRKPLMKRVQEWSRYNGGATTTVLGGVGPSDVTPPKNGCLGLHIAAATDPVWKLKMLGARLTMQWLTAVYGKLLLGAQAWEPKHAWRTAWGTMEGSQANNFGVEFGAAELGGSNLDQTETVWAQCRMDDTLYSCCITGGTWGSWGTDISSYKSAVMNAAMGDYSDPSHPGEVTQGIGTAPLSAFTRSRPANIRYNENCAPSADTDNTPSERTQCCGFILNEYEPSKAAFYKGCPERDLADWTNGGLIYAQGDYLAFCLAFEPNLTMGA